MVERKESYEPTRRETPKRVTLLALLAGELSGQRAMFFLPMGAYLGRGLMRAKERLEA